jgi:hypothetical protein
MMPKAPYAKHWLNEAGPRRVPDAGEGRTAVTWTLCDISWVVRGARVWCHETGVCARGCEYGGERAEGGAEATGINGNKSEPIASLLHS